MIEFVQGTLVHIDTQYVVIDHNGLGFRLYCPNPFVFQDAIEKDVRIYTYQHVREDAIRLFGFKTQDERLLFEKLLTVSGIGPKGALAILASGVPDQVVYAIETEDEKFLMKFPGVGKKTARQIILDLKGKLQEFSFKLEETSKVESKAETKEEERALEEAFEALRSLGYVERELKKIRPQLEKETLTTDGYIRKALQLLLE